MEALAVEAGVAVVMVVAEAAAVEAVVVVVEPTACSSNPALPPRS